MDEELNHPPTVANRTHPPILWTRLRIFHLPQSQKAALEIQVEMDYGRVLVVVQKKDVEFAVGNGGRLTTSPDGRYRIRQ